MHRAIRLAIACVVTCAAACGVTNPSDLKTETHSGTVPRGGQSEQFPVSPGKTGEFIVKVTAIAPDTGAVLLWNYGTPGVDPNTGLAGCFVIGSFPAALNKTVLDTQLPKSTYCMFMSDPGNLPQAETFTFTVSHL